MFRRRRAQPSRREADSIEKLVLQIAEDKGRSRFKPVAPGTERPREVFIAVVDAIVAPLIEGGCRYARSGPHATRRQGPLTSRFRFASSTLNVPGELVSLSISLQVEDATMGAWRKAQEHPVRRDAVVATRHLGHLLDPPRWLEWNLASVETREATRRDIATTLLEFGTPFVDGLVADLLSNPDPALLAGRVDPEALIEYYVRAGRSQETGPLILAMLSRLHERGQQHFFREVDRMRREGLPEHQATHLAPVLAHLVVQFDLPIRRPDDS